MLAFPKNSTQNAGSNENDPYELECSMEAPSAHDGTASFTAVCSLDLGILRAEASSKLIQVPHRAILCHRDAPIFKVEQLRE